MKVIVSCVVKRTSMKKDYKIIIAQGFRSYIPSKVTR